VPSDASCPRGHVPRRGANLTCLPAACLHVRSLHRLDDSNVLCTFPSRVRAERAKALLDGALERGQNIGFLVCGVSRCCHMYSVRR
jgi:hypothetical protein